MRAIERRPNFSEPASDQTRKCLGPKCESTELYRRGVCCACYGAMVRKINSKKKPKWTWRKFENLGWCLPARPGRTSLVAAAVGRMDIEAH